MSALANGNLRTCTALALSHSTIFVLFMQVIDMLLRSVGEHSQDVLDALPAWLLQQLRIAGEPISSMLLGILKRCALAACSFEHDQVPVLPLQQLDSIAHSRQAHVGARQPASALAAFYCLLVVDICYNKAPKQVRHCHLRCAVQYRFETKIVDLTC